MKEVGGFQPPKFFCKNYFQILNKMYKSVFEIQNKIYSVQKIKATNLT